jgi:hypothetical protein
LKARRYAAWDDMAVVSCGGEAVSGHTRQERGPDPRAAFIFEEVEDVTRGNFGLIGGEAAGTLNVLRRFRDPAPLEVPSAVNAPGGWMTS